MSSNRVFIGGQFPQAHRTAGMEPIGGYTGFGAEPELKAIGEAR